MNRITGHYIEVCGVSLHYETAGEGSALICLPMAGASGRQYHRLLLALAENGFRGLALDLPGHGGTMPASHGLIEDTGEYLDFIAAAVDALCPEELPYLLGSSMTANAVLLLAARCAGRFSGIIAAGGGTRPKAGTDPDYHDFLNHPSVNLADYKEVHLPGLCGSRITQRRLNECIWHAARSQCPDTALADARVFEGLDIIGRISSIDIPVLLLCGGEDFTVTESGRAEILALARSEYAEIAGAGHYLPVEQSEEFSERCIDFLKKWRL